MPPFARLNAPPVERAALKSASALQIITANDSHCAHAHLDLIEVM